MKFVDTHSHLYLKNFDDDRQNVIDRALNNGVEKILLPNIDENSIEPMMNTANQYNNVCIPMIAIHPTSVKHDWEKQIGVIEEYIEKFKFCAIGETGIDLYWDKTYLKEQCFAFKKHIEMAIDYDLPIVIHSRNSIEQIFEILENYDTKVLKGVFHCFPGNLEQAKKVTDMGFMIGVGGVVTFKNSDLSEVIRDIDLNSIVLETDAPYLAPQPKRGKRNESSYLVYIAEKIAEIKDIGIGDVAKITTKNAETLFNI